MIRIIGGEHKGRRISAPSNLPVRPTTDYAKEGLFNVLNNRLDFENLKVLDLFSGTGNITYEFASRGAASVLAVDIHYNCVQFINDTAKKLEFRNVKAYRADVYAFVKKSKEKYDLIFADPPYEQKETPLLPGLIFKSEMLNPNGILIIEHPVRLTFPPDSNLLETRSYGKVNFSIFG